MKRVGERIGQLVRYVGFSPADAALLASLRPALARTADALIDDFYRRIFRDSGARAVIEDERLLAGLRISLRDWLDHLLTEDVDDDWLARRAKIGRRHVEVGLPQRYMPLAMNIVRNHLVRLADEECAGDASRLTATLVAVQRLLDLELTVMLDTYHEDTVTRLRQLERLSTISQLAAGVSRELKNPLGVVNTSLFLLRRLLDESGGGAPSGDGVREHLDRIGRASRQASDMTDQLLDYASVRTITRQFVPIAAVVDDALEKVGATGDVVVELHGAREATMFADPVLLARVLMNLVRNAVQAITEAPERTGGGRVVIRWDVDGEFDRIEVSDDGPGPSAEIRSRMFEPMVTSRRHGTGLGLAICRGILQSHGGTIELVEPAGPGATFRIRLPRGP